MNNQDEAKKRFSSIAGIVVLCIIVTTVMTFALSYVSTLLFSKQQLKDNALTANVIINLIAQYLISYTMVFILMKRIKPEKTDIRPMKTGQVIKAWLCCMAITYAGNLIGTALSSTLSRGQSQNMLASLAQAMNPLAIVLTVLIAPIFEELIFRKCILDRTAVYGEKTALLFSSICFALIHGNLYQLFYAFGLGMIFGYIYLRSGKVIYSIVMHIIVNFIGMVVSVLVVSRIDMDKLKEMSESEERSVQLLQEMMPGLIIYFSYLVIYMSIVVAGVVILIKRLNDKKNPLFQQKEKELLPGSVPRIILKNAGMIALIVVSVISMVISLIAGSSR